MKYELAVIGGGPGGYVAAIRAAQLGLKTALIEKSEVGGTCLNRGCVPVKSFAAVARQLKALKELANLGIENADVAQASANIQKVVERKNKIVAGLKAGIHQLIKANKIDYFHAVAEFVSDSELLAGDQKIAAENFIIATGSAWQPLPGLAADGKFVLTSDHILDMTEVPKRLLIVGGGAIGCELASNMHEFGSNVTIVEATEHILPQEDAAIARALAASFAKRGIKIYVKTTVSKIAAGKAVLSSGEEIAADNILVSIGRKPFTDGLNLNRAGIETLRGFISVNEKLQTNVKNIYAVGDVAAYADGSKKPMLAHVASSEGARAAAEIGQSFSVSAVQGAVPSPIFTIPEIASVGMTEKELKEKQIPYKTGRFSYAAVAKAVCDGRGAEGMMIAYVGHDEKILGAHFIGDRASELCSEACVAMTNGLTAEQVAGAIHAHPTYSEIIVEALEDANGRAIHKVRR